MQKKFDLLLQTMYDIFLDDIGNYNFIKELVKKLDIRGPAKLSARLTKWTGNHFKRNRGCKELSIERKQNIWFINNFIPSVECGNGRERMAIYESIYSEKYKQLKNETDLVEKSNKQGILYTAMQKAKNFW